MCPNLTYVNKNKGLIVWDIIFNIMLIILLIVTLYLLCSLGTHVKFIFDLSRRIECDVLKQEVRINEIEHKLLKALKGVNAKSLREKIGQ